MENTPTENPKTGRIVALSVANALRHRTAPVVIGL
jgi:predicted dinucleotide-utilizing enzyme